MPHLNVRVEPGAGARGPFADRLFPTRLYDYHIINWVLLPRRLSQRVLRGKSAASGVPWD